jgi:hypothetical protein
MKKDDFKTAVVFRKYKEGDIIALFPYAYSYLPGVNTDCLSYMHIGQHSDASYPMVIKCTKPAKKEEYKPLFDELESIGYDLNVIKRRNTILL